MNPVEKLKLESIVVIKHLSTNKTIGPFKGIMIFHSLPG
jgi:hypothetical protein